MVFLQAAVEKKSFGQVARLRKMAAAPTGATPPTSADGRGGMKGSQRSTWQLPLFPPPPPTPGPLHHSAPSSRVSLPISRDRQCCHEMPAKLALCAASRP